MTRLFALILIALSFVTFSTHSVAKKGAPSPRPDFSSIDIDNNQVIRFTAFTSKISPHADGYDLFNEIDHDGNGEITLQAFHDNKFSHDKHVKEKI